MMPPGGFLGKDGAVRAPYALIPAAIASALAAAPPSGQAAEYVDLQLVLAVDVSGSMDLNEQRVQRDGYVQAFRNSDLIKAITSGAYGRIAVTYVEWSSAYFQQVVVPWRVIGDAEDSLAFAAELDKRPIGHDRSTSISGGLLYALSAFDVSPVESDRRTIDVSGDGPNNDGSPVAGIRDMVVSRGITINGLPILINPMPVFGPTGLPISLDDYYSGCVIGGPGSFTIAIRALSEFEPATRRKLILEIASAAPDQTSVTRVASILPTAPVDCLAGERRSRPFP
jgi:hypothetical protein